MLDASIMGMGRGAGNLNTELILSHLNQYYQGQYVIPPLLNVMDTVISLIRDQFPWGYSVEYYLSSINDCSPICELLLQQAYVTRRKAKRIAKYIGG